MLSKTVSPKTKAELIRALQGATFRSVEVYEGDMLRYLPPTAQLKSLGATAVVVR